MRDGVFEIPLKLFVGALDQQLRLVRLANEWREVSQREPGNQLLPSRPDQQVDGLTSHFDKRPPREIRRNGSIELSLESNQRQGMPLPEAHGGVCVEIEDNVENRLRIAVEHRRRESITRLLDRRFAEKMVVETHGNRIKRASGR